MSYPPAGYHGDIYSGNHPDHPKRRDTCPECGDPLAVFCGGDEAECEACGWSSGPEEDPDVY